MSLRLPAEPVCVHCRHDATNTCQALRVSVGKLGVLLRIQFRIVKEVPVRRWDQSRSITVPALAASR